MLHIRVSDVSMICFVGGVFLRLPVACFGMTGQIWVMEAFAELATWIKNERTRTV